MKDMAKLSEVTIHSDPQNNRCIVLANYNSPALFSSVEKAQHPDKPNLLVFSLSPEDIDKLIAQLGAKKTELKNLRDFSS